ncbi:MAG: vitamin B12 dependent-methionine synthase activation domain-containing protein [Elusimicrobiales bacterium]|nr:vitamin B12 dependent-methionine synthase activation domain-containing protein [Elusimicrobiales bacterium]
MNEAVEKNLYPGEIPIPPDFERHIVADYSFGAVRRHINRRTLYNLHLGITQNIDELEARGDKAFLSLKDRVGNLLSDAVANGVFKAACVYRFCPAQSDGDSIIVYNSGDKMFEPRTFSFPRQPGGERLCLADFVSPASLGRMDYVALFACTCGGGFTKEAARLREKGKLADSHILNVLAVTCAEALAESLHCDLRLEWGFPDAPETSDGDKLAGRYRGKRYSPGYPAFPSLEAQRDIFALLRPEDIGLALTENFMMEPEASVSALALHNPKAKLFAMPREEIK